MSHFTVAVIHKPWQDAGELLAPYDEGIQMEPYISRTKEDMIRDGKKRAQRCKEDVGKGYRSYMTPYLTAKTDEDFYNAERDEEFCEYDDDGNELSTYNPNSKWDWYSIGGRWGGTLKVRPTEENGLADHLYEEDDEFVYVDSAPIKDVDFTPDKEEYDKAYNWWVEHIDSDKEWDSFIKKEYYTDTYKDATDYATRCAQFSTFAVVTPDGEWHEKGEMGWFACSDETPEEAREWDDNYMSFIENADPEDIITIVDCHI